MIFSDVFSPKSVIIDLQSEDKDELFEEMVQAVRTANPDLDCDGSFASICEREAKMTTGIMHSVAVPHATSSSVKGCVGAVGISKRGIDYDSLDGSPVHFVFMLICGEGEGELHLEVLKQLAGVLQNNEFIEELGRKTSPQEVYDYLCSV